LFEGKKELFKGLYIYDKWDWDTKYPVIYIPMPDTKGGILEDFRVFLKSILFDNFKNLGLSISPELKEYPIPVLFKQLILSSYQKYNEKVVILVDEYDKPVVDNIQSPNTATDFKNILSGFYSELKSNDEYIRFAFLTGVSKFTKISVFSGANNIADISLDTKYANICGYTQKDLEYSFKDYLDGIDLDEVQRHYNGYNFRIVPEGGVYNPFDILLYLNRPEDGFKNYWYETGNPSFFIELLKKHNYDITKIRGIELTELELNSKNIENDIPFSILLHQTGYLTIKSERREFGENLFLLDFPNLEVKRSFSNLLVNYFNSQSEGLSDAQKEIRRIFSSGNFEDLSDLVSSLFANIPYNYSSNNISKYESFYATVLLTYFYSIGLDTTPEAQTNTGRIDLSFEYDKTVYIFEYKVLKSKEEEKDKLHSAIKQIKEKKYYEKYLARAKTIYLIGMEFGIKERNLINMDVEKL
jgi:hypothetical protein